MAVIDTSYRPSLPRIELPPLPRLPTAKSATEHSFLERFKHPPSFGAYHKPRPPIERIYEFCVAILKVLIFVLQRELFVIGFVCGVVWDETCHAAIEKIKAVWDQQSPGGKFLLLTGGFIAAPAVFLCACFLTGASVGGQCHQELRFD